MRTSLPVSTISYNTVDFLQSALRTMQTNGEVGFWAFIFHHGEGGDKDHIHLYCEPARLRTQDDWKVQYLSEYDPNYPAKPLSVTSWRKSKWIDWFKYAIHDPVYLITKGETKEFSYSADDIVSSDPDDLRERIASADTPVGDAVFHSVRYCVASGFSWAETVSTGLIPTRSISNARELFSQMSALGGVSVRSSNRGFADGLFDDHERS